MRLKGPEPPREAGRNLRESARYMNSSTLGAGFVATLLGITGPAILVYQAGANAGYPEAVINSWFFAIFVGGGLLSLLLAVLYREPICGAYPIAGSALLVTALVGYSPSEAVGAFLVSGVLVTAIGFFGLFEAIMDRVPNEVIMGALAGILIDFGIQVFGSLPSQPLLVGSMVVAYLLGSRFASRIPPAVPAIVAGVSVAALGGRLGTGEVRLSLTQPVLIQPVLDGAALLSIAIPLTLLAVATQNAPGVGILRANGYRPPVNAITIFSGIGSILTAPMMGNGVNIAAPMTAVCAGPESHAEPEKRYAATMVQGAGFVLFGVLGATAVSLIQALPSTLVAGVAGLALLPVILQSLRLSMGGGRHSLAAGVALLVGASDLELWGINSAFWAIVAGIILARVLRQDA